MMPFSVKRNVALCYLDRELFDDQVLAFAFFIDDDRLTLATVFQHFDETRDLVFEV